MKKARPGEALPEGDPSDAAVALPWPVPALDLRQRVTRASALLHARRRLLRRVAFTSAYVAAVAFPICLTVGADLGDRRVAGSVGMLVVTALIAAAVALARTRSARTVLKDLTDQADAIHALITEPPADVAVRDAQLWAVRLRFKATRDGELLSGLSGRDGEGPDLELGQRDSTHAIDIETMRALQADARRYNAVGRVLLAIAVVIGVLLLIGSHFLTVLYVHDLNEANDPTLMLILLLVRGTLFGGLAVGFLYGVFSIANAYVDQATRFRKRLYSAHMLNYAFGQFADKIAKKGTVKIADLVALFSAWNANVDSAFTGITFQKESKNLVIGGKDANVAVHDGEHGDSANGRAQTVYNINPTSAAREDGERPASERRSEAADAS